MFIKNLNRTGTRQKIEKSTRIVQRGTHTYIYIYVYTDIYEYIFYSSSCICQLFTSSTKYYEEEMVMNKKRIKVSLDFLFSLYSTINFILFM